MSEALSADGLLYALQGLALARNLPVPERLTGLSVFEPFLDDIRQDKALFLLNLSPADNEQHAPPYVASISGGLHWDRGEPVRVGAAGVPEAVGLAILEYARRCWRFEW